RTQVNIWTYRAREQPRTASTLPDVPLRGRLWISFLSNSAPLLLFSSPSFVSLLQLSPRITPSDAVCVFADTWELGCSLLSSSNYRPLVSDQLSLPSLVPS